MSAAGGPQKQDRKPFIFSLIRELLPHDDQEGRGQAVISDRLAYGLMALATLGLLGSWLLCGISPTREASSYDAHKS